MAGVGWNNWSLKLRWLDIIRSTDYNECFIGTGRASDRQKLHQEDDPIHITGMYDDNGRGNLFSHVEAATVP